MGLIEANRVCHQKPLERRDSFGSVTYVRMTVAWML